MIADVLECVLWIPVGLAEYATPEELFGYDLITSAYQRDPQESKERMMQHLSSILPGASAQQIMKILKG